ncbi:TPA: ead/Ea22-like family protein [Escherichia coli]|nr:ead/Ea22-like family protein [Escherichia coli]HAP3234531.1 ead/Ea22-like family protein [Escherichia coli]
MSEIDYQALRKAAQLATQGEWVAFISSGTGTYAVHTPGDKRCEDVIKWTGFDGQNNAENNARYVAAFNPKVALALLGEIKRLEDTNIDAMCRIAPLETKLAALVAENAGLKHAMAVTLEHVSVTDAGQAGVAAMIINDALHHSETPATDAFLAEIRAEARNEGINYTASRLAAAFNPEVVQALLDERESQNKRIAELEKSEEQLINERDHAESALDDMYFAATGNRPEWSNWFGFSDAVDAVVDRIADLEAKQPSPVVPEGLVKAVRFYEQVKRENPPVETGAWKDAVDWVLKEACQVVNTGIKGE